MKSSLLGWEEQIARKKHWVTAAWMFALVINICLNQAGKSSFNSVSEISNHNAYICEISHILQWNESYVFKTCVFRSIYSSANLASLWAIIWYSSMLKWVFQCEAAWQNWRCPWGKISLSEAAGSVTRNWSRIGGDGTGYLPHVNFSFIFLSPRLIPACGIMCMLCD